MKGKFNLSFFVPNSIKIAASEKWLWMLSLNKMNVDMISEATYINNSVNGF